MLGLGPLIAPLKRRAFFDSHFARTHVALKPAAAIEDLSAILGALDLASLLTLPRRPEINLSTEDSSAWFATFDAQEALRAFDDGYTAYFHIGQMMPALRPHVRAMATACGTPADNVDISLFVSPPGSKTPLHFDSSQNFTLQLSGLKQWHIAANEHVVDPPQNWMPGRDVPPHWHRTDAPQALSDVNAQLELIDQGDGLYIPGGTWHAVEALTESVSLTYSVNMPRHSDILAEAFRRQANLQASLRGSLLRKAQFSPIEPPDLRAINLDPEQLGLHSGIWRVLRSTTPVTRRSLEDGLAAAKSPEGFSEHAWITLYAAQSHLDWTDEATDALNRYLDQEPTA